jgi:thiamine kinase-like enzyme
MQSSRIRTGASRLIDWDHAGVGPASYDLSTFLLRFPPGRRKAILDLYGRCLEVAGARARWLCDRQSSV